MKVTVQLSVLYTNAAIDEDWEVNLPVQFQSKTASNLGIPIDDVTCYGRDGFFSATDVTLVIVIEIENVFPTALQTLQAWSSNNTWTDIVGVQNENEWGIETYPQIESATAPFTEITTEAAGVTAMTIRGGTDVGGTDALGTIGDVGIGTESPTEKLEVNGTIKATKFKLGSATLTEAMILMRPTFCIWAEEKGDLGAQNTGKSEWGFGSAAGGYPLSRGVVIGVPYCKVLSMTLDIGSAWNDDNKGGCQVIKHAFGGPLAALSLTPMHSLRHRLVRSRQYAEGDVAGFLRF